MSKELIGMVPGDHPPLPPQPVVGVGDKELIGQVSPVIPEVPPILPPQTSEIPSKRFLTDLKGEKGDPGVVDPLAVAELVEEYLDVNPAGLYVETFIQSAPSDVWIITHSLPFQPAVTIIDSAGSKVETEIQYLNNTQIRSTASAAFSGTAYLS